MKQQQKVGRLNCSVLAVGDFPEGGATSQRLYLLTRLLDEGLGKAALYILHPASKTSIDENRSIFGEWGGITYEYLSGTTVRPRTIVGAAFDTLRGIYGAVRLLLGIGKARPDVVVLYTPTLVKFAIPMIVAWIMRIPMFIEICEVYSHATDDPDSGLLRRVLRGGESFMERLIPRTGSGLLVISQKIRTFYSQLGVDKVDMFLLPTLIDSDCYENGGHSTVDSLEGKQYLLNSGSFNEKDGLPYLVGAVSRLRSSYPDINLVFTGNAPAHVREQLLDIAGDGGEEWMVFTGFLSRDELIWCYKNAAGLLSCRSNSEYANYGLPTKLAEYLITGRPVIATAVGDVGDYLEDGRSAYLAKPENEESIASAMGRMLGNPDLAHKVGRSGKGVAQEHFDYKKYIKPVSCFVRSKLGIDSGVQGDR